jgi:hypothetical protein
LKQKGRSLVVKDHDNASLFLIEQIPSDLTEIGEKKSMKNPNIKKNPKYQPNNDKSNKGTKGTNQKGVKLKIKIAKLKTNRQCEKHVKTSGSNESTTLDI